LVFVIFFFIIWVHFLSWFFFLALINSMGFGT
jgi:hypothetical protein